MKQKVALTSTSSSENIRIQIGTPVEPEKKLPPSSVPAFIRQAVFDVAVEKRMLAESTTVDTINIAEVIRSTATIKTYINGDETPYIPPSKCSRFLYFSCVDIHNDAYPYDITLTTVLPYFLTILIT